MHAERARQLTVDLPLSYEEAGLSDNTRNRSIWAKAFAAGFASAQKWTPIDRLPEYNGVYLIAVSSAEEDRHSKTRIAAFRKHDADHWAWNVSGGTIPIRNVIAWQPLPEVFVPDSIKPPIPAKSPFLGTKTSLRIIARFLEGSKMITGRYDHGISWQIVRLDDRWLFQYGDHSVEARDFLSGFRWLMRVKRSEKRIAKKNEKALPEQN